MKKILPVLLLATLFSVDVLAKRDWIGGVPILSVTSVGAGNVCAPAGGGCLRITFSSGAKNCNAISVGDLAGRSELFHSMVMIAYTTGKPFQVYGSTEYCNDRDRLGINDFRLM